MGSSIAGIDLFCGAGGLTLGLRMAGIQVVAGVDLDPACGFPFTYNNHSQFLLADLRTLSADKLAGLYPADSIRLLAGCAPCQPFSPFRRGLDTSGEAKWNLLTEFGRLARELRPELVTMENVPRLCSKSVFREFIETLVALGYEVNWRSVYCPRFGIPQHRRRLVLIASLIGPVAVPRGPLAPDRFRTVRDAIGSLPALAAGETDSRDPVHRARAVTEINLRRLRVSRPGGTWHDWPAELRAPCHRKASGKTFRSVYARMTWNEPAPTITTESYNFGTGRFGHPEQDRSISLREAALLQGFPKGYRFTDDGEEALLAPVGRLIGNAVPPPLGFFIGKALIRRATHPLRNTLPR
jgi:DNA (cytosine-5)-methyltransferase 1